MAIGVRPIGSRAIGDSTGQAIPAVVGGGAPTDVSSSDTGVGVESQSLVVALTKTESGAALDNQSLLVNLTKTDSGVAAEGQSLSALLSSAEVGVFAEAESVFKGAARDTHAITYLLANFEVNPENELAAFASLFENITTQVPTPHIWYIVPAAGNRGEIITVVGAGFGPDAPTFEGYVTLGSALPAIEDWRRIVASGDALSSGRSIDSLNDTVDPEHDRIDFRIPSNAVSSDVRVYLSAPD